MGGHQGLQHPMSCIPSPWQKPAPPKHVPGVQYFSVDSSLLLEGHQIFTREGSKETLKYLTASKKRCENMG